MITTPVLFLLSVLALIFVPAGFVSAGVLTFLGYPWFGLAILVATLMEPR